MQAFEQAWRVFCSSGPSGNSKQGAAQLVLDHPGGTVAYGQSLDTFSVAGWTLLATVQLDGGVALWATACLHLRCCFYWDARRKCIVDDQTKPDGTVLDLDAVLCARFRSPDAALVIGTRSGQLICLEHNWEADTVQLYQRWRLLGDSLAPVRLVGVSSATWREKPVHAQATPSSPVSTRCPVAPSAVIFAWTEQALWWQRAGDEGWQSCPLPEECYRDLRYQQQLAATDTPTIVYIGECAPSGRFFAWTYRNAVTCWVHLCPEKEDTGPTHVFSIKCEDPLYSLEWKPPPIRGCDGLLLGDICGRLMLLRPNGEMPTAFLGMATSPTIMTVDTPVAGFVRQYSDGGIAEDEDDAAWIVLSEWRLASIGYAQPMTLSTDSASEFKSTNTKVDAQELSLTVYPRRVSHAVHFVGQLIDQEIMIWRVSHLNDEPSPRTVHFHPTDDLERKIVEHLRFPRKLSNRAQSPRDDPTIHLGDVGFALRIEAAAQRRPLVNAHCAPAKELRSPRPPAIPSHLNCFLQHGQGLQRWYQNGRPGDALSLWSHRVTLGRESSAPFQALFYSLERHSLIALTCDRNVVWWSLPAWSAMSMGYAPRCPLLDGVSLPSPVQWLLAVPPLVPRSASYHRDELAFLAMASENSLLVFAWPEMPPLMSTNHECSEPSSALDARPPETARYATPTGFACVLSVRLPPGVTLSMCSVWSQPRTGGTPHDPEGTVAGLLCWSSTLTEWSLGVIQMADAGESPVQVASMNSETIGDVERVEDSEPNSVSAAETFTFYPKQIESSMGRVGSSAETPPTPISKHNREPGPYMLSPWRRVVYADASPLLFATRTDKVFIWRTDGVLAVYQLVMAELRLRLVAETPSLIVVSLEQAQAAGYRLVVSADAEEMILWDALNRRLHFWSFDGAVIYHMACLELPDMCADPDISFARYRGGSFALIGTELFRRVASFWRACGALPIRVHHATAMPEGFLACSRHDHLFVFDARSMLEAHNLGQSFVTASVHFEPLYLASMGAGLSPSAAFDAVENQALPVSLLPSPSVQGLRSATTTTPVAPDSAGIDSDAAEAKPDVDICPVEASDAMTSSFQVDLTSKMTTTESRFVDALRLSIHAHQHALEALDPNAGMFVILSDTYHRLGQCVPPEVIQCAMHTTCEEAMLEELGLFGGTTQWQTARQFGCGYWVRSPNLIHRLVETIARASFSESRQPRRAVLWYVLLQRPRVLSALFRGIGESKIAAFFARNFDDPTARQLANKNAFAVLARHEYELAAAFFILSGDLDAAMQVVRDRMEDEQLALLIARREPTLSIATALEQPKKQPVDVAWHILYESILDEHDQIIEWVRNIEWMRSCTQSDWPRKLAAALLQTKALSGALSLQRRSDFVEAVQRLRIRAGHILAHGGSTQLAELLVHPSLRVSVITQALGQHLLSGQVTAESDSRGVLWWLHSSLASSGGSTAEIDVLALLLQTGHWLLHQSTSVLEQIGAWMTIRRLLGTSVIDHEVAVLDRRFLEALVTCLIAYTTRVVSGISQAHYTNETEQVWLMDAAVLAERFASLWHPDRNPGFVDALSQSAELARFLWVWQQAKWTPMNTMHAKWHSSSPSSPTVLARMARDEHASMEANGSSDRAARTTTPVPPMPVHRSHCLRVLYALCLLEFLDRWATRVQSIAPPWAAAMRTSLHMLLEGAFIADEPLHFSPSSGQFPLVNDGDQEAVMHLWCRCWQAGGWLRTQLARAILADHGAQALSPEPGDSMGFTQHRQEPITFPVRFVRVDTDNTQRSIMPATHRSVLLHEATLMTAVVVSAHEPTRIVVSTLKPHRGLCELTWESEAEAADWESFSTKSPSSSESIVVRELRAGNWHGRAFEAERNARTAQRSLCWRSEILATSLAAHPFSNRYISGDVEGALHFWAFGEPVSLGQLTWSLSRGQVVQRVRFAPHGGAVAAAYASGLVALWQVPDKLAMHTTSNPERVWRPFGEACVHDLCFIDEAQVIAVFGRAAGGASAAATDGALTRLDTVRVFDLRLDESRCRPVMAFRAHEAGSGDTSERPSSACEALCGLVLSDRTRLLSASSEGHLAICDMRTARCAAQFKAHPDGGAIRCLAMEEPRARALVTGTDSGHVRLWDARTLRLLEDLGRVHRPTRHFRARARASQHASSLRLGGGTTLFGLYGVECALLTDYSLLTGGGDGYLYAHGPGWGQAMGANSGHVRNETAGETQALLRRVQSGLLID